MSSLSIKRSLHQDTVVFRKTCSTKTLQLVLVFRIFQKWTQEIKLRQCAQATSLRESLLTARVVINCTSLPVGMNSACCSLFCFTLGARNSDGRRFMDSRALLLKLRNLWQEIWICNTFYDHSSSFGKAQVGVWHSLQKKQEVYFLVNPETSPSMTREVFGKG